MLASSYGLTKKYKGLFGAYMRTLSYLPTCRNGLLTTSRSRLLPRAGRMTLTRRRRQSSRQARRTWPSPCLPGEGEPPTRGHTLCLFSFWILFNCCLFTDSFDIDVHSSVQSLPASLDYSYFLLMVLSLHNSGMSDRCTCDTCC